MAARCVFYARRASSKKWAFATFRRFGLQLGDFTPLSQDPKASQQGVCSRRVDIKDDLTCLWTRGHQEGILHAHRPVPREQTHFKEAAAFKLLQQALAQSAHADKYELVLLSGASRADALFRLRGSPGAGLQIQLKSSSNHGDRDSSGRYVFSRVSGYNDMLVVLVSLDTGQMWAAPGASLATVKSTLNIHVGARNDSRWKLADVASHMVACFRDPTSFPHISEEEACLQCAPLSRTEAVAHQQLARLFECVAMNLVRPHIHMTPVDSLLSVTTERCEAVQLRLQEKASNLCRDGRYKLQLRKGARGCRAYAEDDFDLLAACVLHESQLHGVFLMPMTVLVNHGFAGPDATKKYMSLFPKWSLPKRRHAKVNYNWQPDYFLDLREWQNSGALTLELRKRLQHLVHNTSAAASASQSGHRLGCKDFGEKVEVEELTRAGEAAKLPSAVDLSILACWLLPDVRTFAATGS